MDTAPAPLSSEDEILSTLLDTIDPIWEQCRTDCAALYANTPVTCAKGCGACCHFPLIPATTGEAFVLYHLLQKLSGNAAELDTHLNSSAALYLAHARQAGSLPFTEAQQTEAFHALHLPCPLFVEDGEDWQGSCAAFALRPLICGYFHSLDAPELCAAKSPHRTLQAIISRGEEAIDQLMAHERLLLGRSTLGHLPLLLAAFSHSAGRQALLRRDYHDVDLEGLPPEELQGAYDFSLYAELLGVLGYRLGERDIASLIQAKEAAGQ